MTAVADMTETEFAQSMVTKYRLALTDAAGLTTVTVDGQSVAYAQLEELYDRWQKKLSRLDGTRPTVMAIDLRHAG